MRISDDVQYKASKTFAGFAIAPLTPCIVIFAIAEIQGRGDSGVWFSSIVLPISYLVSAVIGLPVYVLLKRFHYNSIRSYIMSGALAALVPFMFIVVYPAIMMYGTPAAVMGLKSFEYYLLGMMIIYGALVAGAFWLIVRPDRSASGSKDAKS